MMKYGLALMSVCVGLTCFALAACARADELPATANPGSDESVLELAPLFVTAPVPPPESSRQGLPFPATGITREQFEKLPNQRLGDVLQRIPGVTMGGAPGERKDVRLRGMDKEFTRMQFDGVQLPGGGEKREFQVFRFPSFLVDDVTVIRNPTAEYEADGIAGRINVDVRDIPFERRIDLETGAGGGTGLSFGEDRVLRSAYGERFNNFGLQIAYSHQDDPIVKDKIKTEVGGKSETEDEKKDGMFNDLFADLAWFGTRDEIHLKPLFLDFDEDKAKTKTTFNADGSLDKSEIEDANERRRTVGVIIDHEHRGTGGFNVATKFAFATTTEDKDTNKFFIKADGSLDKTEDELEDKKDETFELGSKATVPFMLGVANELKFGGTVRRRDRFRDKTKVEVKNGVTTDKTSPKDTYFLEEYLFAGFAQDTLHLGDRFSLTPGVRFEHVFRESTSGALVSSVATISDILPSLHAVYRPTTQSAMWASVSRQVNRPKFDELAPFRQETGSQIIEGNPDLQPARAWSFDLGADYAATDLFLGLNLFHREVTGVIENVDTGIDIGGKDLLRTENVGDGYVQGIELEQRMSLAMLGLESLDSFSVRANQTFIRSQVEDDLGQTKEFNQQPGFIGNISLVYTKPYSGTTISLSGNYVSDIPNDDFSGKTDTTRGEFYIDLYAETRVIDNVRIFGWIENIAAEERRKLKIDGAKTEIENESTGRAFMVGLQAAF